MQSETKADLAVGKDVSRRDQRRAIGTIVESQCHYSTFFLFPKRLIPFSLNMKEATEV